MRRIAAILMLVGFCFAFFTLNAFGIDMLIDAVGFLLVFNGVRVLHRLTGKFKGLAAVSLVLAALGAVRLFLAPLWLVALCAALLAALCALVMWGCARTAEAPGPWEKALRAACLVVAAVWCAAGLLWVAGLFLAGTVVQSVGSVVVLCAKLAFCVALLCYALYQPQKA